MMKTHNLLPLLCSSLFLYGSAFSANTAAIDVNTTENSDKSSNDASDKEKDSKKEMSSSSGKTPASQMYVPQTDDRDEDKPKKSRKKRTKKGSSKVITSVSDDKMPLAKGNAICPIGLEGSDAREIFRGFSYEGFQKSSTDGESNLNHGFLPKPWGFFKGKDGVNYAVYAFKPDDKNIDAFLGDSVSPMKLTRLKIKEYCALYTEVGEEFSNNNGKGRVGLVISRDSFFKPKPLDPGAVKVAAVMSMIQKGQTSSPMAPVAQKNDALKDKQGASDDAKVFQKMSDEEKSAAASTSDDSTTNAGAAPDASAASGASADATQNAGAENSANAANPSDASSSDATTKGDGDANAAANTGDAKPADGANATDGNASATPAAGEETPVQSADSST